MTSSPPPPIAAPRTTTGGGVGNGGGMGGGGGGHTTNLDRSPSSATQADTSSSSSTPAPTTGPSPSSTRCVIVQKDEKGFGLRVSGDNPVFVESVRPDGAAWRAGVRAGDRIIKVNGTLVTKHGHQEVVRLIQAGGSPYVSLHLLGRPPPLPAELLQQQHSSSSTDCPATNLESSNPLMSGGGPPPPPPTPQPSIIVAGGGGSLKAQISAPSIMMTPQLAGLAASTTTITAPLPATSSTLAEFERTKEKTIKAMIKRENQHLKAANLAEGEHRATLERLQQLSE